MRLVFKSYDSDKKTISFDIEASPKESEILYSLQQNISNKINRYDTGNLKIKRRSGAIRYTVNIDTSFLFDTQKYFLDANIQIENWIEFIVEIERAIKRDLSIYKKTNKTPLNTSEMEEGVLLRLSNAFLTPSEQSALKQTSRKNHQDTFDYAHLLSIHFPSAYQSLQEEKKCVDDTAAPIYKETFDDEYAREYKDLMPSQKKLLTLFKAGALDEIKKILIGITELLSASGGPSDIKEQGLLFWANKNKQQAILDHCFSDIIMPVYQLNAYTLDVHKCLHSLFNYTILHWAILCNQSKEMIIHIVESGANVDAVQIAGITPLMIAVLRNNLELVKCLVAVKADVNKAMPAGETALSGAIENGHFEIMVYLIVSQASIDARVDDFTLLMIASEAGYLDIVTYLIDEKNADVNDTTSDNFTALHYAARNGHLNIVRFLVMRNTNVQAIADQSKAALTFATKGNFLEVVKYFIEELQVKADDLFNGCTALGWAAYHGHLHIVRYLVEHGANVNAKEIPSGVTPLMSATSGNHLEIVKYLIEVKANANDMKSDLSTALHIAADKGYLDIVRYLVEHQANLDPHHGTNGITALICAIGNGYYDVAAFLIENNADVNHGKTQSGLTPLIFAASLGELETVKRLVAAGANLNATADNNVTTAFMLAAKIDAHPDIICYLISQFDVLLHYLSYIDRCTLPVLMPSYLVTGLLTEMREWEITGQDPLYPLYLYLRNGAEKTSTEVLCINMLRHTKPIKLLENSNRLIVFLTKGFIGTFLGRLNAFVVVLKQVRDNLLNEEKLIPSAPPLLFLPNEVKKITQKNNSSSSLWWRVGSIFCGCTGSDSALDEKHSSPLVRPAGMRARSP